ncbi:MAG: DUF1638 domain-containing protein [Halofilum sp. (in: g-proteobacteria)]|nr:DUF1638 domain-containing protein [Halofilum sp. (in: g-proteobacteria)]
MNASTGEARRPGSPDRTLIVACGALAHEIVALIRGHGWDNFVVQCLPADLHNTPGEIPGAVRDKIRRMRADYDHVFVAYADCGTGGQLDRVLEEEGVERLPGAHCYEFFAGTGAFHALAEEEVGTFYLTDFLARHFDRLVIHGMGLDRHPELLPMMFGHYRRLVYLAQTENPDLETRARAAAERLGLEYEYRFTGYGELGETLAGLHDNGPADEKVVQWRRRS